MVTITRIGAATFETTDVARLSDYYKDVMGMRELVRTANSAVLSCANGSRSVVIAAGEIARCARISLEVANSDDLEALRIHLSRAGVETKLASDPRPGVIRCLSFAGPGAFDIDVEVLKGDKSETSSPTAPVSIAPRKLGHIAFKVDDPSRATAFFTELLGFRVSDWIGDFFAFLRCGPDHHTVNFLRHEAQGMHHVAFELRDMDHLQTACDVLGRAGIKLIWGPGRHGPGHNVFTYHHNPDGQIIELFTQLDTMSDEASGCFDPRPWHNDNPQKPKVWAPSPYTSNRWGPTRPPAMDA